MALRFFISLSFIAAASAAPPQGPAPQRARAWGPELLREKAAWYATTEARGIADTVLQYQSPHGAWPKNTDLTRVPSAAIRAEIESSGSADTIDNGATTTPMRFLALVGEATGDARYRGAFERGLDYLFSSQYPNGGWPQFFPLREGYYAHVTFNDDAMVNVMALLRDVAAAKPPYAFTSPARQARAKDAFARGVEVILRTQLRQGEKLTAWCAQYDEKTLEPAWARKYEPPSLSGNESVGLARLLMGIEHPKPEVVAAVEGAVAWLQAVTIPGLRLEEFTDAEGRKDRRVVTDAAASPLWARFYELGTNRPIFLGRDSKVHYALAEIEHERRNGYAYYGAWPAALLTKEYPRWRARVALAAKP
jgi:PelA/Pel-15E family pectate lyase